MNQGNNLTKSQHITNSIHYFHLICLDENLDRDNNNHLSGLFQDLEKIVYSLRLFSDFDQCVDYITDIEGEEQKAIILYSGELVENIIHFVQDIPQIDSIYILSRNRFNHEDWRHLSPKVKDGHNDLTTICKSIKQTVRKYYQDYLDLPCLQPNTKTFKSNRNELEPSFMYMLILKEIFLNADFEPKHFHDFIDYCRAKYCNNGTMLGKVTEFEQRYKMRDPISWYTDPSFIFSVLNEALRMINIDLIIKFDFFIRDLHQRITTLHAEQFGQYEWNLFNVYRGQVVPQKFFDKLRDAQGGLVSFNNFLSTSRKLEVSLMFATPGQPNSTDVGVLFRILLDPTIKSNVFANIQEYSSMEDEEEILFSMHSIFRLGEMKINDTDNRIWEIDLTLTTDTDVELCEVAEAIRTDAQGSTPWERLGHLMIKMNLPKQAELIYKTLLQNATTDDKKAHFFHQLGVINVQNNDFKAAEQYYKCSQEICQNYGLIAQALLREVERDLEEIRSKMDKSPETSLLVQQLEMVRELFLTSPHLLYTSINNTGAMYDRQGNFHKAIEYYEEVLKMREKSLPPKHPLLAASYCSTGAAYSNVGEYKKAMAYLEKALEIQQKSRPANHPDLAITYSGLGSTYLKMKNYPIALSCYKKALGIQEKSLLANDCHLITSYNNIGEVYSRMGDYSQAERYHQRALELRRACLSENHLETAISYHNLASTFFEREDYTTAISFYEQAVAIQKKFLPESHLYLATSYQNMGRAYYQMGNYSRVLSCHQKELALREQYPPVDLISLAATLASIGLAYSRMGKHSDALLYYEQELAIHQCCFSESDPALASSHSNVGFAYHKNKQYPEALSFCRKALEIQQKYLPADHPDLARALNNIGLVYSGMGKHAEAISHYVQATTIQSKYLSTYHPELAASLHNIASEYYEIGMHWWAIIFAVVAVYIGQCGLPEDHSSNVQYRHKLELIRRAAGVSKQ